MANETIEQSRIKNTHYIAQFMFYLSALVTGVIISHGSKLNNINSKLEQLSTNSVPSIIQTNVIGSQEPEKFYQFGANRAYLEIDGKKVEDYLMRDGK